MRFFNKLKGLARLSDVMRRQLEMRELQLLAIGKQLSWACYRAGQLDSLADVEFKIFSQFGDDGIIQWLIHHLDIPHKTFIEFGVENYRESNTRFLMMNNNWSGFVMDGSERNIVDIVNADYFWKYDLAAKCAFIDRNNVNELVSLSSFDKEVGLLHIDLDGNDYWIWKELTIISPVIVIIEFNSIFGADRAITVPYDKGFQRTEKHHSNLYFGASLSAVHNLAERKGYSFIGCNSAGNNAYFVRKDKLNGVVGERALKNGYVACKFRESRNEVGDLTFVSGYNRTALIRGMPVHNILTDEIEAF
ncbi:hypothetical protein [Variovorax sp. dw_308]|uniref:hypothetical protein n=1 Tax=Variovorax sp. dw_308 TaxID=2721546 RepID=UPI001C45FE49|nr:hypothetical protein [Variovorax sp. dw_308]